MTTLDLRRDVTAFLESRRGASRNRAGAVLAVTAWLVLWAFFLAGVAGPAGRLASAGRAATALATGAANGEGPVASGLER